jgi:glycerophosphoryl diester phosphodiesterase
VGERVSGLRRASRLHGRYSVELLDFSSRADGVAALKKASVNILAPPMPALLATNAANEAVPSIYAQWAKQAGLKIISWTTEHSGRIVEDVLEGENPFHYHPTLPALSKDGDILRNIHVLA